MLANIVQFHGVGCLAIKGAGGQEIQEKNRHESRRIGGPSPRLKFSSAVPLPISLARFSRGACFPWKLSSARYARRAKGNRNGRAADFRWPRQHSVLLVLAISTSLFDSRSGDYLDSRPFVFAPRGVPAVFPFVFPPPCRARPFFVLLFFLFPFFF